jgi:uncharacterized protein YidB (DUF937 family)
MSFLGQVIGGVLASRATSGQSNLLMSALMGLLATRMGGTGAAMGGLQGLVERMTRNGHADTVNSWIGHGENRSIAPHELERALDPDDVDRLSRESGMPRQDLLSQLSELLPGVVDKLTPNGRMPNHQEMSRW